MARAITVALAFALIGGCTIESTPAPQAPAPPAAGPSANDVGTGAVEPSAGPPGTYVSLIGDFSRLSASQLRVIFAGSEPVQPSQVDSGSIVVEVPANAETGSVAVYAGQYAVWRGSFSVTATDDALLVATAHGAGLLGAVYRLPSGTNRLPSFDALGEPHATIVVPALQIAPRKFDAGFPGLIGTGEPLLEWFAIRFTGKLLVATEGSYAFQVLSDDGAKLYIDGRLVADNDGVHPPQNSRAGALDLAAGDHDIVVEYFQGPRYEIALELRWQPPGTGQWELIPPSAFARR